jgi:hypothetical protein
MSKTGEYVIEVLNNLAEKEVENKLSYVDLPYNAIQSMAKVFGDSKQSGKYSRDNHFKPIKNTDLLDSIQRHLIALINGEDLDQSGNSHYAHIMSNAAMLEESRINETLIENRINRKKYALVQEYISTPECALLSNPSN